MKKICSRCGISKPLEAFAFQNTKLNKKMSACKDCMNKQQKEFRANNSELQKRKDRKQYQSQKKKRVAYAKEYRKKHPDRTKRTNLKVKYGISLEEYNDMKERQQGKCAICGKHEDSLKKSLCVDHCHSTGVIRGLLCDTCNKFLGFYEKLKGQCELYLRKE